MTFEEEARQAAEEGRAAERSFWDDWQRFRVEVVRPLFEEAARGLAGTDLGVAKAGPDNGSEVLSVGKNKLTIGPLRGKPRGVYCSSTVSDQAEPLDLSALPDGMLKALILEFARNLRKSQSNPSW